MARTWGGPVTKPLDDPSRLPSRVGTGLCMGIFGPKSTDPLLAALRTPDPGRDRPKTSNFLMEMMVRTLSRDPPGKGGPRIKLKIVLSTAKIRRVVALPVMVVPYAMQ